MSDIKNIHYKVTPSNASGHIFSVELTIQQPDPAGQKLTLPPWIPGSYMIRDFARNVVTLNAGSKGQSVTVNKLDKQSWQCEPCSTPITISYDVYAWDLSVRSAHLDTTHGYFNGTSLFLAVEGQTEQPCSVELIRPEGDFAEKWQVATTLQPDNNTPYSFGLYSATNYDELIDHPVEMADFTLIEFEACGIPHAMALTGRFECDLDRIKQDLIKICEYEINLFGEAPFEQYLFQVMVVGSGYGGLEHRSSTSLLCSRDDLPKVGEEKISDSYRQFLALCSHEYFHSWNIKRIKPATFLPYDLTAESYTPLLWAFEGITSYYDELILVRSGVIESESYLELLGQTITRVLMGTGRHKQTVSESSFDAWTKFYKQDENAPNAIISYYTKGAMVALALDLILHTQSDITMDDVMRALWQKHGKPLIGVTSESIESLISEISGLDLNDFFNKHLRSTEEIELESLLKPFAVDLKLRAATNVMDKGGKSSSDTPPPYIGLRYSNTETGNVNATVIFEDSPAQKAGISSGDTIVAINGLKTTASNVDSQLKALAVDQAANFHFFRRDELMTADVTPQKPKANVCYFEISDNNNPELKRWLNLNN